MQGDPPDAPRDDAPDLASELLDLREKPPEPLAASPQALGVWELAWPTILSLLTQTLVRLVDFAMVGSLGPDALAAVGLGGQLYWFVQSISTVAPTGVVAVLARAVGARDERLADSVLRQGLWLTGALGALTLLGLPFTSLAIRVYGVDESVVSLGSDYLYWLLFGAAPMSLAIMFGAALRAAGDTRSPLWIGALANLLNVFLNWVLIFGHLGAPALGVAGAAIASSLAMVFQVLVFGWLWGTRRLRLRPVGASWRPDLAMARRLLRIGYPALIEGALYHVGLLLFQRLMAGYGTAAIAAYNVGAQILALSFLPGSGFATAAATLVGQHLGDAEPERAARSGWRSVGGAVISMTALAVVVIAFAEPLARLFSDDARVVELTVDFVWILGAVMPLMAVEFALGGALRGAGDTRFPMFAVFVGLFIFRLVPATLAQVVFESTLQIVWSALVLDYAVKAALLWGRFQRRSWQSIEV